MKKLLFVFFGLAFLISPLFGQTVEPPSHIWDVIRGLLTYLNSPEAYAVAVPVVGAFFTGIFKIEKDWPKKLIVWGVSIVGLVVADLFDFGFVAAYPIWEAALVGLFLGFTANGIFAISVVKPLIDKIHDLASKIVPTKE